MYKKHFSALNDQKEIQKAYNLFFGLTAVIAITICFIEFIFAKEILFIFGNDFEHLTLLVQIFTVTCCLNSILHSSFCYLYYCNHQESVVTIEGIQIIVSLILSVFSSKIWSYRCFGCNRDSQTHTVSDIELLHS